MEEMNPWSDAKRVEALTSSAVAKLSDALARVGGAQAGDRLAMVP